MINCSLGGDGVPSYEDTCDFTCNTSNENTCNFTCNTGYDLMGDATLFCEKDGSWIINDTLYIRGLYCIG